ncbi:tyrosine-protein phosphatase [Enterobacillus tribolii]|uniref:Protein tyrosine phosphatase n=1 Tax=Enterobacillus tribolii TaxID=1487935 RepID=A0A370R4S2_9GAMM|nr:tyrosine-protein phosphatase [Enterobacillus tribolii]MBW7983368.1 tyrosine-protein phosphatase [Enterobacillus tribolii]RDK97428.1 protein tyrosine phosphatase [Enterobacillus tribolii]
MNKSRLSLIYSAFLFSSLALTGVHAAPAVSDIPAVNQQMINPHGLITRDGDRLTLTWQGMPEAGSVTIKWQDLETGNSKAQDVSVQDGKVTIDDPNPQRRTLFMLPAGQQTVTLAERKLPVKGMDNLRDMGGLKTADGRYTKWGLLYRADTPHKAKAEGYGYLRHMNMGYVFDLRRIEEIAKKPDPAIDGVTYHHTQIPDEPPAYADVSWETDDAIFRFVRTPRAESFYVDTNIFMVDAGQSQRSMKQIFDTALKGEGKAMLWHCAGGKDRTGYVSAMFLAALGVPQETIVNEYLLTNEYRQEFDRQELADMSKAFNNDAQAIKGFKAIQQSRPEYILAGLKQIEKEYGSVENYLEKQMGVTAQQIARLKMLYTE